jgi:hypothetical protein
MGSFPHCSRASFARFRAAVETRIVPVVLAGVSYVPCTGGINNETSSGPFGNASTVNEYVW